MAGETNIDVLIREMEPELHPGAYVFCSLPSNELPKDVQILASFREEEGMTLVVEQSEADQKGWDYEGTMGWITLSVHSALEAVGLTAAFSNALAQEGISCNVVAAFYHDHLFVPLDQAEDALNALKRLSANH